MDGKGKGGEDGNDGPTFEAQSDYVGRERPHTFELRPWFQQNSFDHNFENE